LFWNVAGLMRYDKEEWDYIKGHEYIGLCEMWVDKKIGIILKRNYQKRTNGFIIM